MNQLNQQKKHREQWSSRFGFILAATGAAVGLGNIWKFPYMAGDNGGGAFVLVYLICVIIIGLPVMLAEMLIGRHGKQNAVNSLLTLARQSNHSCHWQLVGWWGAATLLLVLSFYSVVASWTIAYLIDCWRGLFNGLNALQINQLWQSFLANPWTLLGWHSLFMFLIMWVVSRGVQNGLEKASRIMMPGLFIILIILDGYATSTPGFAAGAHFLLDFDFDKITPSVIISAMGHAFFTLAIGAGCMLIYASYLSPHVRLGSAVVTIAVLDVIVAILAGLAIFPIVFSYHLSPQGGPGLMFEILPIAFAQMGGGQFFGGLFFLLLLFAAWTSSISLAEPLVSLLIERYPINRFWASVLVGVSGWALGIVSLLSFNVWKSYRLFGRWDFFTVITDTATNIMLPIGGLLFAIFAGWVMSTRITQQELAFSKPQLFNYWLIVVRFIAPVGIILILINALF